MEAKTITGNKGGMGEKADIAGAAKKPEPEVQRRASKELMERVCRTAKTIPEVEAAINEIKGMGDKETLRRMAMGEMVLQCREGKNVAGLPVKALMEMGENVDGILRESRLPGARAAAVSALAGDLTELLRLCGQIASGLVFPVSRRSESYFAIGEAAAQEIDKIASGNPDKAKAELGYMRSEALVYIAQNLHAQQTAELVIGIIREKGDVDGLFFLAQSGRVKEIAIPAIKALANVDYEFGRKAHEKLRELVLGVMEENRWVGTIRVPNPERERARREIALEALNHLKGDLDQLAVLIRKLKNTNEMADSEDVAGAGEGVRIPHLVYATVLQYLALKMASGELSEVEWLKLVGQ